MNKRFVIFIVLTVISVTFTIIFSLSVCGLAAVRTDFAPVIMMGAEELRLTHKFFVISAVSAAAVTTVLSLCYVLFYGSSAYCFFDLLFCWQYPLFAWAFGLRKLKRSLTDEISA
ncbi:MAG: hypothetical protein HDR72_02855 [Ruminococcaceae bacterium]|nr:hypothetical protein [Oscillospiraceae bacterium]